jgi:hypothetical protein
MLLDSQKKESVALEKNFGVKKDKNHLETQ